MKKILLSIFALASINAMAQGPTITASDMQWTAGNEWYMKVNNGYSIGDFTATGTGVSWDLTSFESSVVYDTVRVVTSVIADADISISSEIVPEANYSATTGDYSLVTGEIEGTTLSVNPFISLGFPRTDGGTSSNSGVIGGTIFSATIATEVLASGSVTTSYGTFNAILVRETISSLTFTVTTYYWETKEYGRIATLIGSAFSMMGQNNFDPVEVSNSSANVVADAFKVYPNPASNNFNVTATGLKAVQVFDALGNLVLSEVANNNTVLVNTTGLNAGIYFVQAASQSGLQTSRVIVK